ncbi:unnamed protein product [Spirodela intermedia]|uniref:Uncharacterized protein n=1 Tax=Spirodela intermedia TaxID=51605 RepID=A0A7I8L1P8_SPIIN|nr:unnamed protein product [Spirodela intermedia]
MEGSVDVTEDPLVHSIKAQISEADDLDANSRFKKPIIHRMRTHVRDEDPGACRPKVVSIGPFHHGDASLRKMETLKRKFTHEEEARAWYSEELELDSNEFVEMMIFDGCFLIELFLTYFREGWVFLGDSDQISQVTELVRVGVKLTRTSIKSRIGSLEIPSLTLEESTKTRLQNLIILELVHPQVGDYFTCYATLMGSIIKTAADVEILRRCGILYGKMQNDEAAHMFKSLCRIAKCD